MQIGMIFLMLVLLGACSTDHVRRKVIVPAGEPEWLYAPENGCRGNLEICASGEGLGFQEADVNALKSLASIFEVEINGKFEFSRRSFSGDELTEMQEDIRSTVGQQIDVVLNSAQIKERFKKDGLNFSLASLDKGKAGKILKDEIKKIDNESLHFYKLKSRLHLRKLNLLFNQRLLLNEKLIIIDGEGLGSGLSFSAINSLKFNSKGGQKIYIWSSVDAPKVLVKKIEEVLTDVGYQIRTEKNPDYSIKLKFEESEEFLNVKGFKKFTFIMTIETSNSLNKHLGTMIIKEVSSGRTKKDAFLKIRNKMITTFESSMSKLNLN